MKFLLSALVLLFIGLPNPGSCNDLQCFAPGECISSQEINIVPSQDEFQCNQECKESSKCAWYTFFPDSNACHLLSSCGSIEDTYCQNCISGQKECDIPKPVCFAQGNIDVITF